MIFSQNFHPSSFADSVRAKSIVEYLNSNGHHVTLFTQTIESKAFESPLLKIHLLKWANPTNNNSIIKRLLNEFNLGIELFCKIVFLKKKDYYIFTSPPFFSCVIGILAKIFKTGDLIFDVRDLYPDVFIYQKLISSRSLGFKLLKLIERFIYNRSKIILVATEGLQREILNRVRVKKVILYKNGYSEYFKVSKIKEDKFTVVFHGSLSRFQNVELMIDVVKEINLINKNINFIVIGSGPKDSLVKDLNVDNLRFLGRLSNEDTATIVNKCHIGLSLRDDSQISIDAFPVKLYEYIGSGIPSIITPCSEGGKEIERLNIGYNLNNNLDIIVKTILMLESDRKSYNAIKQQILLNRELFGRKYITKKVFDSFLSD